MFTLASAHADSVSFPFICLIFDLCSVEVFLSPLTTNGALVKVRAANASVALTPFDLSPLRSSFTGFGGALWPSVLKQAILSLPLSFLSQTCWLMISKVFRMKDGRVSVELAACAHLACVPVPAEAPPPSPTSHSIRRASEGKKTFQIPGQLAWLA